VREQRLHSEPVGIIGSLNSVRYNRDVTETRPARFPWLPPADEDT